MKTPITAAAFAARLDAGLPTDEYEIHSSRPFVSTKQRLHDLYDRTSYMMKSPEGQARFGRMAAEYFGETMHQGFDGYYEFRVRRDAMRLFADAELCFSMMDTEEDEDIAFVDEYVQEYAALMADAGDPTRDAGWQALQHLDAIRDAIDPRVLRSIVMAMKLKKNEDIYRRQAGYPEQEEA